MTLFSRSRHWNHYFWRPPCVPCVFCAQWVCTWAFRYFPISCLLLDKRTATSNCCNVCTASTCNKHTNPHIRCAHTYRHARARAHTHTHTHTYTHTHTHTHTHTISPRISLVNTACVLIRVLMHGVFPLLQELLQFFFETTASEFR